MSESNNSKIKAFMRDLIESGIVHGRIAGPKDNVLVCDTLADWAVACGELVGRGHFEIASPGGYGGASPAARANTHNKIWRSGTACASIVDKRVLVFSIPRLSQQIDVVWEKEKVDKGNSEE